MESPNPKMKRLLRTPSKEKDPEQEALKKEERRLKYPILREIYILYTIRNPCEK
jgi:hypothetical protein